MVSKDYKLIISVLDKKITEKVLTAIEQEGVSRSTIMLSRGRGADYPKLIFDIMLEPERETLLTLVHKDKAEHIFDIIMNIGELDKPLTGIVFIVDVDKVGGIIMDPTV